MAKANKTGSAASSKLPGPTFVLDNGAYSLKAGFASAEDISDDDHLKACELIPNCLVRLREKKTYIATQVNDISQWYEAIFRRPVENGQIVSWEVQKEIWEHSMFDQSTASSKTYIEDAASTTLLLTDQLNNIPLLQKNTDEIVMEEWGFGGYVRTAGAPLNAFNDLHPVFEDANAPKYNSCLTNLPMECLLVIDSGYSYTTITPCFQGRPIQRAIRRLDLGGKHLTNLLKETVSVRLQDLHQETKVVNDLKEDVSFVSQDFKKDLERTWKGAKNLSQVNPDSKEDVSLDDGVREELRIDYVLPDGVNITRGHTRPFDPSTEAVRKRKLAALQNSDETSITLGNERFTIPEVIFNPSDTGSKQPGLPDCVVQSLNKLPPLIQATMIANVIVVGGNARIPGFVQRLESELRSRVNAEWLVRVRKMRDPLTSTWLGGVRLSNNHRNILETQGVTKEQYDEYGSAWTARHFVALPDT